MFKLTCFALAAAVVAGCEAHDLRVGSSSYLEPVANGVFKWKTIADAAYPIDSDQAEAARMRQLAEALRLNSACLSGYSVDGRAATKKSEGAFGDIFDIFYTVRCN